MRLDKEVPRDEELSQLYRLLPKDMPTRALDENILAEARRHTHKELRWKWVWRFALPLTAVAALALFYFGKAEQAMAPPNEQVAVLEVPPSPDVPQVRPKAEEALTEVGKSALPAARGTLEDRPANETGGRPKSPKKQKAYRSKVLNPFAKSDSFEVGARERAAQEFSRADASPVDEFASESMASLKRGQAASKMPKQRPLSCSDFSAIKAACLPVSVEQEGIGLQFKEPQGEDNLLGLLVAELKRKGFVQNPGRLWEFNHSLQGTVRLKKLEKAVWLVSP